MDGVEFKFYNFEQMAMCIYFLVICAKVYYYN
jgi:hypothetical protein